MYYSNWLIRDKPESECSRWEHCRRAAAKERYALWQYHRSRRTARIARGRHRSVYAFSMITGRSVENMPSAYQIQCGRVPRPPGVVCLSVPHALCSILKKSHCYFMPFEVGLQSQLNVSVAASGAMFLQCDPGKNALTQLRSACSV